MDIIDVDQVAAQILTSLMLVNNRAPHAEVTKKRRDGAHEKITHARDMAEQAYEFADALAAEHERRNTFTSAV